MSSSQPGAGGRYQMRRALFSIGEDYWITDAGGRRVLKVDAKVLRVRETLVIEDAGGNQLASIHAKLLHVRPTMVIERDGRKLATVRPELFSPLRHSYTIDVEGGPRLEAQGNLLQHEYRIQDGDLTLATVSKRWVAVRDTYGIEIAPGQDEVLLLAAAACVERMVSDRHEREEKG